MSFQCKNQLGATFFGLVIMALTGCSGLQTPKAHESDDLLQRFANAYVSPELFTRFNGINEFDLHWDSSKYFFYLHDHETPGVRVRTAPSISALATAEEVDTGVNGLYPTVERDRATWHLWVWNRDNNITQHYTSSDGVSGWVLRGDVGVVGAADWHVRRLSDSLWLAGAKMLPSRHIHLFIASRAEGPWLDQGEVFDETTKAPWYLQEEADPAPFKYQGKLYLLFAGWDGEIQRPGIVELDPITYKARSSAVYLLKPFEPWQIRNQSHKLFNPVFLDDGINPPRIYYSQNPSTSGVTTGWGYIEARNGED